MNLKDLQNLVKKQAHPDCDQVPANHCLICKQPFSDENVFTKAGWRETKITQYCEKCWDKMFS